MSALNSFKLGVSLSEAANQRRRQRAQDEWLREEQEQTRLSWQEQAAEREEKARQRAALAAAREGYIADLDQPGQMGVDSLLQQWGVRGPDMSRSNAANAETAALAQQDAQEFGLRQPMQYRQQTVADAPAPLRYDTQTPEMAGLRRMATLASTPQELSQLEAARIKAQQQQEISTLYQQVLNAPPEVMDRFAQNFTSFKGISGEIVPGPNGISTLKIGNKAIPMDRPRMAQYVTALYKMHKGDMTGANDLAAIDKDLAETMYKEFGALRDTMTANNDATSKSAAMANDTRRTNAAVASAARERVDPLKQKIETLQDALGRNLTETEIKALGGLTETVKGLQFVKTEDGQGFFADGTGTPVGRFDPQLGMVPTGSDPRANPEVQRAVQTGKVQVLSTMTAAGPMWVYVGKDGEAYDNLREAMEAPEAPAPTLPAAPPAPAAGLTPPRTRYHNAKPSTTYNPGPQRTRYHSN